MPKNLNNRLENLENEIQVLLTIQEGGSGACQVLRGKSITDGNVERIEFEGNTCPTAKPISGSCDCQPPCSPPACLPRVCPPPVCSPRACSAPVCSPRGCPPPLCSPPVCLPPSCLPPICTHPVCVPPSSCVPPLCVPLSCVPLSCVLPSCAPPSCASPSCVSNVCFPPVCAPPGSPPKVQCLCKCICATQDQGDDCKEFLKKLQNEMKHLEGQLRKVEKEKQQAMSETKSLRGSFQRLSQDQDELNRLKGERDELSNMLEEEATGSRRRSTTESEREAARREKKLKDKLCRITANSETIKKRDRRRYQVLSCAVRNRDDHIRNMSDTSERLIDILAQRDLDIQKLHDDIEQAHKNLLEAENANKALAEQNAALLRAIKDLQDKLLLEKNCIQKLIKFIEETKLQTCRLKEEIDSLKCRLKSALERPKEIRKFARLEEKLRESREREQLWLDEAAEMKATLDEKEKGQEESEINYEEEVDKMYRKNKKLSEKYGEVLEENETLKDEVDLRLCELREEYEKLLAELRRKNQKLVQVRNKIFRELETALKEAARIREFLEELLAKFKELYALLCRQQEIIAEKDEYILRLLKEIRGLKAKIARLEQEIMNYKDIIEKQKAEIDALKTQLEELKAILEQLKAENAEKDKLIAEYQRKIDELNDLIRDLEDQLDGATAEANATKEQLEAAKGEISSLNEQLEEYARSSADKGSYANAPDENKIDYKEQFKRKVELLERKRELQLELVIKQKEQSVQIAKVSAQKLLETVMDFQNQTCSYTKIQSLLACLLCAQEDQIRAMHEVYNPCETPTGCLQPRPECKSPQCPNTC